MSGAARALLAELTQLGAAIDACGGTLKLRAPEPLSPDLLERVRAAKPEILAALSAPAAADIERAAIIEHDAGYSADIADRHAREGWRAEDWRAWLSETAARRRRIGDDHGEASRFAYGAAISEWHARHGARRVPGRCPGCERPIDERARVLALPGGERVHGVPCLVRYGARWRSAAADGLAGLGISAPTGRAP